MHPIYLANRAFPVLNRCARGTNDGAVQVVVGVAAFQAVCMAQASSVKAALESKSTCREWLRFTSPNWGLTWKCSA